MKKILYLLIAVIVVLLIIFHSRVGKVLDSGNFAWLSFSNVEPLKERAARAEEAGGDIIIGVVGPWGKPQFNSALEGVRLAADEINASGGILGRKIQLVEKDDRDSEGAGELIAQKFCDNLDMIAVLGHINSSVSNTAAVLYDYNGLLMITPMSTDTKVLSYRPNGLIFRNTPESTEYAETLIKFMRKAGGGNLIVYNATDDNSEDLADMACVLAHREGVIIVDRRNFDSTGNEVYFRNDLENWKGIYDGIFDSILVIGPTAKTAEILKEVRALDFKEQLYVMDIPPEVLIDTSGETAEGVICAAYDASAGPAGPREKYRNKFIKKFDREPDSSAMRGYDTMMVLAAAITGAGSTVPQKVAGALGDTTFEGLFGPVSFDEKGGLVQERCAIFQIKDSKAVKLNERGGKKTTAN